MGKGTDSCKVFADITHFQYYILFHILSTCFLNWFTPHLLKSFSKAGICKSFRHKESVIHKSGFLRIMNHAPDCLYFFYYTSIICCQKLVCTSVNNFLCDRCYVIFALFIKTVYSFNFINCIICSKDFFIYIVQFFNFFTSFKSFDQFFCTWSV